MKYVILSLQFVLLAASSSWTQIATQGKPTGVPTNSNYTACTIPSFFRSVVQQHNKDFYRADSLAYLRFCENNRLLKDSLTFTTYYTFKILHELFTSQTATNGSVGDILTIPYLWHWVRPNPRHQIRFVSNGQLLSRTKPPAEFARYTSWADIDRTPYLFLSDMVSETPAYQIKGVGTFSTFGWCSEREMAFVALLKLLSIEGYVIVDNNHSWSEYTVVLPLVNGQQQPFHVKTDNTFHAMAWTPMSRSDMAQWKKKAAGSVPGKWYNQMAQSQKELMRIKNHRVPANAALTIEAAIFRYLKKD